MGWVIGVLFVAFLVYLAVKSGNSPAAAAARDEKAAQQRSIVCQHCQTRGYVTSRRVVRKRGISGGKATGALFTGGASMLATGLSRKQWVTHMRCASCGTEWDVA
jgi:DNA-directed RNA polymerase subunit RPC12/RpoP